jgi:hypothetical protein
MLRAIAALEQKIGWEPQVQRPYRERVERALAGVRHAESVGKPRAQRQALARAVRQVALAERARSAQLVRRPESVLHASSEPAVVPQSPPEPAPADPAPPAPVQRPRNDRIGEIIERVYSLPHRKEVELPNRLWFAIDDERKPQRESLSRAVRRLLEEALEARRRARGEPPG